MITFSITQRRGDGFKVKALVIGWFMNAIGTEQQWADALKAEQKKLIDIIESLRCLLRYDVISVEYNRSGRGEQSSEGDWVKWEDVSEIIESSR